MPRIAKDEKDLSKKEIKSTTSKKNSAKKIDNVSKSSKTTTSKKTAAKKTETKKSTAKKATTKKAETKKSTAKKATTKKAETKKSTAKKTATKKAEPKKTATKKAETKKTTTKKTATKKAEPKKTTTKKTATKKAEPKKATAKKATTKKIEVVEYYDLPLNYNKTVVKVLAQTPNILFVYWDISEEDKQNYINKYGEFFFNDTKPVLVVHNETMKYNFEIDINDYANSWYLHIEDANCDYQVELGRRPINKYAKINDYLPISSSNDMDAPNDHILFDTLNKIVYFRNVKTNIETGKDISLSFLTKIGKLFNIKDFYKTLYKDENIDFERLNLKNMPSS